MTDLVVVDIQPAHEKGIRFLSEFIMFLNKNHSKFKRIVYFFNGPELGYEDHEDIAIWLIENGLNDNVLSEIEFFEKTYGFFRNWMDTDVDPIDIVTVGKYMVRNRISDSRDLKEDDFISMRLPELVDYDEVLNIPDIIDDLIRVNQPILCGGGRNECLLEVELLLKIINKKYKLLHKFIY